MNPDSSIIKQWECDECGWATDSPEDQAHSTPRCLGPGAWRTYVAVDALGSDEALLALWRGLANLRTNYVAARTQLKVAVAAAVADVTSRKEATTS